MGSVKNSSPFNTLIKVILAFHDCDIFVILRKAFDAVDHKMLFKKLIKYGIRIKAIDEFVSIISIDSNIFQLLDEYCLF